jgi:hypothetical protein
MDTLIFTFTFSRQNSQTNEKAKKWQKFPKTKKNTSYFTFCSTKERIVSIHIRRKKGKLNYCLGILFLGELLMLYELFSRRIFVENGCYIGRRGNRFLISVTFSKKWQWIFYLRTYMATGGYRGCPPPPAPQKKTPRPWPKSPPPQPWSEGLLK